MSNSLNILLITTHLNTGGITSYLLTLTKGLIGRGVKVFVASSGGNMEEEFTAAGAKVVKLNIRTKSELNPKIYLALGPLKELIRERQIGIVHAHTRITQVMGEILQKKTKCGFVSTCHGFFKPKLARTLFPCWGHRVIAISDQVQEHLIKDFKVKKSKIALIHNGIDLQSLAPVQEGERWEQRSKYFLRKEKVIGCIARFSDVKGQDLLIKAMPFVLEKYPDTKLFLVGQGPFEKILRAAVKKLSLDNVVSFYPIVNQTREMLSVFDVFAMPSRQEGLGLSILEAQACGVPVVGTSVGGIPSIIEDRKTGVLVAKENPESLAQGILSLLDDPDLMENIRSNARKFVEQNFSSAQMVDKTIKVYEEVIHR